MIKIFLYDIKHHEEIECLHPFHIGTNDTHYIVDEYENAIAYGDLETMKKKLKWLEDMPVPAYKRGN